MSVERPNQRGRVTRVDRLVDALLKGDRPAAGDLVDAFLAPGLPRSTVISELLQPAQERIGELWYEGVIEVADEHRATGVVEDLLNRLAPTRSVRPVAQGTTCILAAVGDEQHVIGLRALRLVLEDDGWTCEYLGAMTPAAELVRADRLIRPRVVLLTAAYLPSTEELADVIARLKKRGSLVLVGGAAVARVGGLWRRLGADGFGPDARVAQYLARRMAGR